LAVGGCVQYVRFARRPLECSWRLFAMNGRWCSMPLVLVGESGSVRRFWSLQPCGLYAGSTPGWLANA